MVEIAIGLGVYAYLILALGLIGWLYPLSVSLITFVFAIILGLWLKTKKIGNLKLFLNEVRLDRVASLALLLIIFQVIINFLGAISPELSFDALWYHLTSAKLYVQNNRIFYLEGWLLWPANMPRLADMFYVSALSLSDEILAKLIHFIFGVLSSAALYQLLRRYFNLRISLLGVMTFYVMLIVGWQSTSAYIDLARTFFEILALDFFLRWVETKKEDLLIDLGTLIGLAIATKMLAFTSLLCFVILFFVVERKKALKTAIKVSFISLVVALPWFALSFINTGNPLFPLFGSFNNSSVSQSVYYDDIPIIRNLSIFPLTIWNATFSPDNIISVIYLLFLPLILSILWKQPKSIKITALFCVLAVTLTFNYSNRYLLPYLPAFTLVLMSVFNHKWQNTKLFINFLIILVFLSAFLNFSSRVAATQKFFPYLTGQETKDQFLVNNLNFNFGDFYDVDGYFEKNIQKDDLVLIYDIHNLYYVNFPFIHESMAKEGTYFTHILVGNGKELPEKFGKRLLLYENSKTRVKLYLFGEKYQ